ncbi:MAG: ketoacyl-ACP synthase III [Parabacteroides sp.]|nr:ketoacyl-ACP synthase III [Parabacteroides sp.]
MAYLSIPSVKLVGISACVPQNIERNSDSTLFSNAEEREKFILSTGIEEKRVAQEGCCSSDFCFTAAEKLIHELNWEKTQIDALVFVSQTPDYILPATACVLQERLNLNKECLAFDISLGCSGWVYGMSVVSSLLLNGCIKKALLLCGDLTTRQNCVKDKTSYPLFGDAGTATALIYDSNSNGIKVHLATDGSGKDTIIIPDGGYRNPTTNKSLIYEDLGEGKIMTRLHSRLDGMSVFSFAISKAPKSVMGLCEHYGIDLNSIDCFPFHQANMFLNEKIRTKLKIDADKMPYCMEQFGNTSCASLPLTLVVKRQKELTSSKMKILGCAFGVGLSWGSIYFETDKIIVPDLIEI